MKVAMTDKQDLSALSSDARLQGHQVCKRGRKYIVECKSPYVAFAPKVMAIPPQWRVHAFLVHGEVFEGADFMRPSPRTWKHPQTGAWQCFDLSVSVAQTAMTIGAIVEYTGDDEVGEVFEGHVWGELVLGDQEGR